MLISADQVLSKALTRAEKENATVYLQRVPNFSDLPEIQPYILVKSLPLTDVDASTETLFQTVIPDNRCHFACFRCACCLWAHASLVKHDKLHVVHSICQVQYLLETGFRKVA